MRSTISILGFYKWDETIFDGLSVPAGINKDTVVNSILLECAELEVLYSNPDTFKTAIATWSDLSQQAWNRMAAALSATYDPVENYNRQEEWEDGSESEARNQVAGYNGNTLTDSDKATAAGSSRHTGRIHGNIGVTTNQQMITEEMTMRTKYNLVDIITGEFKRRFCLLVY